jgi:GeoRSP system SPASM domain protein
LERKSGRKIPGHITLTGGEPFVRKDLFDLLDIFEENKEYFSFSILTNGTYIDREMAARLKDYHPTYVQISMEGSKEVHESIRGNGTYDKAVNALKYLHQEGIYTVASFTAHKQNYHEFPNVVKACKKIGVDRVWSDRLIPSGSGEEMAEYMLSQEETQEFFQMMRREKLWAYWSPFCHTEVAMHRALQFLEGGTNYVCQAGKSLVTIDVNGDVYPCRRMPTKVGNVLEQKLIDIYQNSSVMQGLRNPQNCSSDCQKCGHFSKCQGGLRCLTYAVTGSPYEKDPGCWITT